MGVEYKLLGALLYVREEVGGGEGVGFEVER